MKDSDIVGKTLAAVLPQYDRVWFKVPHLLKLNLILIVPLLSSAVAGYDGKYLRFGLRLPQRCVVDVLTRCKDLS